MGYLFYYVNKVSKKSKQLNANWNSNFAFEKYINR